MKHGVFFLAMTWTGLWLTPDQAGQRLFDKQQYADAAEAFQDPLRQGVAWYRAGEFEKATQAFARLSSPEARYNLGNAWVMLGKYDKAVASYDQALEQRPDWTDAQENRALAVARGKIMEQKGGDLGDQQEGADEVVFDKKKPQEGQDTQVAGDQAASDSMVQAMWLRNVQTKPADFLRAKFAYQLANEDAEAEE
ncbi:Tetratricopeptide repeat protein [Posidoniimonas corsicana]|uniref:Tetratricopeptide repeat protein n=1 Tax=Posidoniimonas corsicana TaxID=1938618 RepID=A0A5C5VB64_9BACT|nr:tetratricopeptide repeat protein [Posidoniimonas corsicana]TWT35864.1 Tetratricopeptide repeat protein [Posidoniimonas corsicana]